MAEQFVKVDMTREECDAVHEVCELAGVMLQDLESRIGKKRCEVLRTKINSVRYKMGAASTLFGTGVIIETSADMTLAHRLAKKDLS